MVNASVSQCITCRDQGVEKYDISFPSHTSREQTVHAWKTLTTLLMEKGILTKEAIDGEQT
jgi:hypothetical protein